MKELTDAEQKEFWEWCGFTFEKGYYISTPEGVWVSDKWYAPNGNYFGGRLPPIDLNNLFKWAVPKLKTEKQWDISLESLVSFPNTYLADVRDSLNNKPIYKGQDKDPALALFQAIYPVLKEAKGE